MSEGGADQGGIAAIFAGAAGDARSSEGGMAQLGDAGAAGAGGAPEGSSLEQLSFCARLDRLSIHSNNVVVYFDIAVYNDPCVDWVTTLHGTEHHSDFLNNLAVWNLRFWGCFAEGVSNFGLIYEPAPLSQGDAELLIDHYLRAATTELQLSSAEDAEMRAALERLARTVVVDPSSLPSHVDCLSGAGGAGGAPSGAGGVAATVAGGEGGTG